MVVCHVNMWRGHKVGISLGFFLVYSSKPPAQTVDLILILLCWRYFLKGFYIFYFMLKKHFPERTQSKSKVCFWGSICSCSFFFDIILTVFFVTDQGCYELTKQMTKELATDHAQVTLSNSAFVGTYSMNVSVEMNRYFKLFL